MKTKSLVDKIIAIAFPSGIGDKARNRLEEAIPLVLGEVFSDREKALNDKEKTLLEKEKILQEKIFFFGINRDACKRQLHSFRKGLNAFVPQAEELLSLAVLINNHPELKEEGDPFTLGELAKGVNPSVQQLDPIPDSCFPYLPEEAKDLYSAKGEGLGKGLKWSDEELIKADLDKRDVPFGEGAEKKNFLVICGLTLEEFEDYQTRFGVDIIKDFEECRWERVCSFCGHMDRGHCSLTRDPVGRYNTCGNFKLFYSDQDKVLP